MDGTRDRHKRHASLDSLIDRVLMLRSALEGITRDNASLRRELARVRSENRALRDTVGKIARKAEDASYQDRAGRRTTDLSSRL
jgi:hypothetical protein